MLARQNRRVRVPLRHPPYRLSRFGWGGLRLRTAFRRGLGSCLSFGRCLCKLLLRRLGGRLSPELSLQGTAFGYTRAQLDASAYREVRPGVVLAGRTRIGTILGSPRDKVAPSRRFYAGGGASVRGYGYQSIGPRDQNNDPIGGRSLAEFAVEARVRLFGNLGLVPFLDAGNIYTDALPTFGGLRYGTGLGLRYYSNFGPIRVDVGTPINPQPGDTRVAVYVSLGQAF